MNRYSIARRLRLAWPLLAIFAWPAAGYSQVAVAEIEELEEFPTISKTEIDELIGPIALYPDDLLAIVLPASTYPLQVVEASRFLEDLEDDSTLQPDEDWDDSIVALLNYPEVIALLNEDLDWTWRLGEAVVAQQSDVISAIEEFRDRAYAAGNLKSDDYQLVSQDEGAIQITPVQDDVIYVPYYEPEQVVVYQPRPVYYYYPNPYPVYYYPYPSYYSFHNHFYRNHFWGVTTAFSIGWHAYHLNTFHHSFYGHPYYGHSYRESWWYRRPDIHVYNNTYVRNNTNVSYNRTRDGDHWSPRDRRTVRVSDQRITRTRTYPNSTSRPSGSTNTSTFSSTRFTGKVARDTSSGATQSTVRSSGKREPIKFRDRPSAVSDVRPSTNTTVRSAKSGDTRKSSPSIASQRVPSRSVTRKESEPRAVTRPSSASSLNSPSRASSSSRSSPTVRSAPAPRSSSPARSTSKPRSSSQSRSSSTPKASSQRSSASRSSKSSQSSNRSSRSQESRSSKKDH